MSIIVPDFYHFCVRQFMLFSPFWSHSLFHSLLFLAFHLNLGMPLHRKRKQRGEDEAEKEICYGLVRFDLHRSTSPPNFSTYFTLRPICNPLTKKKQRMFNIFINQRLVATDINLQGDSNHKITGGDPSHWVLLIAGVLPQSKANLSQNL